MSLPIQKFYEKLYGSWAKSYQYFVLKFPKYLFISPEREVKYLEDNKP